MRLYHFLWSTGFRKKVTFFISLVIICFFFFLILPSPKLPEIFSTVLFDKDGKLLGASIASDEQWRFPPADSVSEKFVHAITVYEDKRFFYHPGIDPLAYLRAIFLNIKSGGIVSGGSTLTMQVIRLSRPHRPRSFTEKIIEALLALKLEFSNSKREILNLYASYAPFGGNVVGLEAASWRYFGCEPEKLSWAETAMLAVLPNSPSLIHPGRNRERLRTKRDWLLTRLWHRSIIDSLSCVLAKSEPLPPKPFPIPLHVQHLLARIQMEQGERLKGQPKKVKKVITSSRIKTTLDKKLQLSANSIVLRHHKQLSSGGINNAAAMIVEVETGNVLAYVGNIPSIEKNEHGNFVDIIPAPRSTGSILKPLLYASMVDEGETLPEQLVPDIPTRMGGFCPENYSRSYEGAVPASKALARSLNVPAVHLLHYFGVDRFYAQLKRLGMTTLHRPAHEYGLTLILGGAEGSLWDLVGMYAGMARCLNDYFAVDTSDRSQSFHSLNYYYDEEYYLNNRRGSKKKVSIIEAPACWLTMKAMLEVVRPAEESAWRSFVSSKKIAWKTGTSYGFRDGWAIGVTPRHAAGVWVGNADGEGRPGLTGIATAAPILFELFGLLDVYGWFSRPEADLIEIEVCAKSGFRKGQHCHVTKKTFVPFKALHTRSCPYCKSIHCDRNLRWQVHNECHPVHEIETVQWFVLPPTMEWYYKKRHSDYKSLPPYREDCLDALALSQHSSLDLIYPKPNSQIYIPFELDGKQGRVVLKAAHRDSKVTIYWHLDNEYIGATKDIHQMAIITNPGEHVLTLVDEKGEMAQRKFTILKRE